MSEDKQYALIWCRRWQRYVVRPLMSFDDKLVWSEKQSGFTGDPIEDLRGVYPTKEHAEAAIPALEALTAEFKAKRQKLVRQYERKQERLIKKLVSDASEPQP